MTSSSDATVRYLKRVLELNPVWRSSEIMDLRARALKRKRLDQTQSTHESELIAALRQDAKKRIAYIQSEFWRFQLAELKRLIDSIDTQNLPEFTPVVRRLQTAASCRGEFPSLSQENWMDRQLFEAFKSAVVLPPAEAALAREKFLARCTNKQRLKKVKAAVNRIETDYSPLYALERDWFHTIKNHRIQSAEPRSESSGDSIFNFDFSELGWGAGILVLILIRVVVKLMNHNWGQ